MGALNRFKQVAETVLFSAVALLMLLLAIDIAMQVLFRYVINDSLSWTDEIARLLLVWMTFLGAGLASFRGSHLKLDLLTAGSRPQIRSLVSTVVTLLILGFLTVLSIGNMDVIEVREGIPFTSFALSSKYLSYAINIGALLMAVGSIISLLLALAADYGQGDS